MRGEREREDRAGDDLYAIALDIYTQTHRRVREAAVTTTTTTGEEREGRCNRRNRRSRSIHFVTKERGPRKGDHTRQTAPAQTRVTQRILKIEDEGKATTFGCIFNGQPKVFCSASPPPHHHHASLSLIISRVCMCVYYLVSVCE